MPYDQESFQKGFVTGLSMRGRPVRNAHFIPIAGFGPVVIGIYVAVPPTNQTQSIGGQYDYTGVVIHALYSDGSEADITDQCTFAPAEDTIIAVEELMA